MNIQKTESFISTAEAKGYVTASVAKQTRTALEKMKRIVDPAEVESLDLSSEGAVEDAFRRFMTKYAGELTTDSANVYVARVKKAVDNGARYLADPLSFKPTFSQAVRERGQGKPEKIEKRTKEKAPIAEEVSSGENHSSHADSKLFTTNFPLRPDFMLTLRLPRDLTTEEVRRMAYNLLTLCPDFNPFQSNIWQQGAPESKVALPKVN